jgi:hypothetical protein
LEGPRVGRRVAGGDDKEGVCGVVFEILVVEEFGAIDADTSKVITLQSTLHELHKFRDSGTLRCQNEGSAERGGQRGDHQSNRGYTQ